MSFRASAAVVLFVLAGCALDDWEWRPRNPSRCNATAECAAGRQCCDGQCVDTRTSARHCGACGTVCDPAQANPACVSGACTLAACAAGFSDCDGDPANGCEVAVATDPGHCGRCNNRCAASAGQVAVCNGGTCRTTCPSGLGDCDGDPANGCEVNFASTPSHCGRCGAACAQGPFATASCAGGRCAIACQAGRGDCDGDATNGCETDLGSSTSHCARCGNPCRFANAIAQCTTGTCVRGACAGDFGDCNGIAADGCETSLVNNPMHCGACRAQCPPGRFCVGRECVTTCPTSSTTCGDACVDLRLNVLHCGTCDNACVTRPNAAASCVAGACGVACNAGWADCNGVALDGCETRVLTSAAHCGACGAVCPSRPNATPACREGSCAFTCNPGQADCNANPGDGCEARTSDSVDNCGACGTRCSFARATARCATGACAIAACETGWGNCDGNATNGCETSTSTSTNHCGACGRTCAAGLVCSNGACAATCAAGSTTCSRRCVNVQTSTSDCGACGRACAPGDTCTAGRCTITAPPNDRCTSAATIGLGSSRVTLTVDLRGAAHDLDAPCYGAGGADVFYRFTLTRRELVYADTFGTTWDTRLFFASSCATALATSGRSRPAGEHVCDDDRGLECTSGGTASQVYALLDPGTWYLVLSSDGTPGATTTLNFEHIQAGSGAIAPMPRGATLLAGSTASSPTGTYASSCGGTGPESAWWWVSCPEQTARTVTARTCNLTSWNTVLSFVHGDGRTRCNNDDPGCGASQSSVATSLTAGSAGIHALVLDGYGGASGLYAVAISPL